MIPELSSRDWNRFGEERNLFWDSGMYGAHTTYALAAEPTMRRPVLSGLGQVPTAADGPLGIPWAVWIVGVIVIVGMLKK